MDHTERVRQCPPDCVCDPCFRLFLRTLPPRWTHEAIDRFGHRETNEHGTPSGYQSGCRDRCCTQAANHARKTQRKRKRAA